MFRWFDIMTTNCGVDVQWKGNNNHKLCLLFYGSGKNFIFRSFIMHMTYRKMYCYTELRTLVCVLVDIKPNGFTRLLINIIV